MLGFLQTLLPRLRQFSQSLGQTELFVDKPWVLLDEDGKQQTYIFRRNGELLMSLDGLVQMGSWEYIAPAESILIDRKVDKLLLNHFFFTEALLVLARDGRPDTKFILANRQLIPDLNVEAYLRKLEVQQRMKLSAPNAELPQLRQTLILTVDGIELEFFTIGREYAVGNAIQINGSPAADGRYVTVRQWGIYVQDGLVQKVVWPKLYKLATGAAIIVDCRRQDIAPNIADRVYLEHNLPLTDGKYTIINVGKVRVKEGTIDGLPFF